MGYHINSILEDSSAFSWKYELPRTLPEQTGKGMAAAFFLHSLYIGGSQMAILEMIRRLRERQILPVVYAIHDGDCKDTFLNDGIPCCIIGQPANETEIRSFFINHFDFVWLNTVSAYYFSYFFLNADIPVIWWFHETKTVLATYDGFFPHPQALSDNIVFASTTQRMQQDLKDLYHRDSFLLPLCIEDCKDMFAPVPHTKTRFFLPGTYKTIKGYDIFLKAINLLPAQYREQAEFICCGYTYPDDMDYRNKIGALAAKMENVEVLDALSREELYRQYAACDCVAAPSRLDSMPLTIIEGMMFEKLTLTSDAAGISVFIRDCVNGFVFPSENAEELMKRMALIIADRSSLQGVAAAGRLCYEQNFSPAATRTTLDTLLSSFVSSDE